MIPSRHELVIPNRIPSLRQMSAWLNGTLKDMGMNEQVLFHFDLCANEAVSNVIGYAFPDAGEHLITVRITRMDDRLSLEIEDDGMPFNPLTKPRNIPAASLEEAEIGGLGVDLIRHYMDDYTYRREAGRNILMMTANLA